MTNAYRTDRIAYVTGFSSPVPVDIDPIDLNNVVNTTSEVLCLSGAPTTIVSYTVPAGKKLLIKGMKGTGHIESEFDLYVNASKRGFMWTSAAKPSEWQDYSSAPIVAVAGDSVTIQATQYETPSYTIRAALEGELQDA